LQGALSEIRRIIIEKPDEYNSKLARTMQIHLAVALGDHLKSDQWRSPENRPTINDARDIEVGGNL
jgi:hypothetical protein